VHQNPAPSHCTACISIRQVAEDVAVTVLLAGAACHCAPHSCTACLGNLFSRASCHRICCLLFAVLAGAACHAHVWHLAEQTGERRPSCSAAFYYVLRLLQLDPLARCCCSMQSRQREASCGAVVGLRGLHTQPPVLQVSQSNVSLLDFTVNLIVCLSCDITAAGTHTHIGIWDSSPCAAMYSVSSACAAAAATVSGWRSLFSVCYLSNRVLG
jgi:hypothetical protein